MKLIIFCLFQIILCAVISAQMEAPSDRKEAERIWELAIEAKGGRSRLMNEKNMFISSKMKNYQRNQFFVYPGKIWTWDDYRPSIFGVTMEMYNWETGKKYLVDLGQKTADLKPIDQADIDRSTDKDGKPMWVGFVVSLLESKWSKPTPVSVHKEQIEKYEVDVVETVVSGKRVDVFLDSITHLPVQISFYHVNSTTKFSSMNTVRMSDYVDFDGIKMPTTLRESDGNIHTMDYKFNSPYNSKIFELPPLPVEKSADAWIKR